MRLDLIDLRLFLHVFEAGSITAGAERSHMTLASASERIRHMEDALGTPLLTRGPRGTQATPAGHTLVHHARAILLQLGHLYGELGEYGAGLRGTLRLLCNTSAASEYLPPVLAAFLQATPGVSVDIEERPSQDIADALRNGIGELGFATDAADLHGLQTFPFRPDPLVLVVARDHPLAGRRGVRLADVADQPFIGLAASNALEAHIGRQAQRIGRRLAYRVRLRSFEAVCRMAGAAIGIGIVPASAAARHTRRTGIARVRLDDAWAARTLHLCMRDRGRLPGHAEAFVRACLQSTPEVFPDRPRRRSRAPAS